MIKVLCTLGPTSLNEKVVQRLTELGVHMFRINLSHTPLEEVEQIIYDLGQWTDVPICLDSEGAQMRNGYMSGGQIYFAENEIINIHRKEIIGDESNISFSPELVFGQLKPLDQIQVDFNSVAFSILECGHDYITARVVSAGEVGSNKGAVIVGRPPQLPAITQKDKSAFKIGLSLGVANYALSFTNRADDVELVRAIVGDANLISKIESIEGVLNIKEILPRVDQILIDRGDLSREIPIAKIPFVQRSIISYARKYETPVYVATNLLESMIVSDHPSRAEANDVASTLLMGGSGLVLAAETAIGKYPIEAAEMIFSIIEQYESWSPEMKLREFIDSA